MRSAVQVYALVVCFCTLMCFVVVLGVGMYDLVQIAAPQFTLAYYQPYQSNETFRRNFPDKSDVPDDDLTLMRREALDEVLAAERRAATQSAVFVLIVIAIDVAVFASHWRIARIANQVAAASR